MLVVSVNEIVGTSSTRISSSSTVVDDFNKFLIEITIIRNVKLFVINDLILIVKRTF